MDKEIILIISGETSGCVHVRLWNNMHYINANYEKYRTRIVTSPIPIFDANFLSQVRCIIIHRLVNGVQLEWLKRYKELAPKFNIKLISEYDDQFSPFKNESIPEWNMSSLHPRNYELDDKIIAEACQYLDGIIVSTYWLAKCFREKFNYENCYIIENANPRSLWQLERRTEFNTEKPKVMFAGCPQHFRNPQPICPQYPVGVTGHIGDFSRAWIDWVIMHVNKGDIDFHTSCDIPYFWDGIRDKIQVHPWVDTNNYPGNMCRIRPEFIIAPLRNCVFDKMKSDIKRVDCACMGTILMGTKFEEGPYANIPCGLGENCTVEDIDKMFEFGKQNWKALTESEYNWLNKNGRFIESDEHVSKWLAACSTHNTLLI